MRGENISLGNGAINNPVLLQIFKKSANFFTMEVYKLKNHYYKYMFYFEMGKFWNGKDFDISKTWFFCETAYTVLFLCQVLNF